MSNTHKKWWGDERKEKTRQQIKGDWENSECSEDSGLDPETEKRVM